MPNPEKKNQGKGENYSNKVFETLQCFTDQERKRLLKYLRSPFFVQSEPLVLLCQAFSQEIEKNKTGFERQKIWKKIAPGEAYHDVNFRKHCSDLSRHVLNFMAHESLANDPVKKSIETLEFVIDHKVEPLFKNALEDARATILPYPYRSLNHFHATYLVERQYYAMMEFDVKVDKQTNLEEISKNLDLFYWIEKLKIGASALSQQKIGSKYDIGFIDEVKTYLSQYPLGSEPELAIYFYAFLTLSDAENVTHYFNLKRLLDKYGAMMPQKEAIELVDSALHYCTRKINNGDSAFYQEYFDLFEGALDQEVFIVKGELATWRFNNMIAAALRLRKLDWAENFIQKYHVRLPLDSRSNTYSFNLARVYRYQGKFESVLGLLRDVEYQDIGYNLISKTILTITYYELNQIELLHSFLVSFQAFLKRNKKVPYKLFHLNLIKYTRRLIKIDRSDRKAKAKLRDEITREKASIVNYEWLLEKLA